MDGWEWKRLQRNATKLKNLEYTIWGTKIVTQTLNKPCLHDIVFPNEKMTHGMEKPEGWQNQLDGKTSKTIPRDEHVSGMRRPARWQYPQKTPAEWEDCGMRRPSGWDHPRDEKTYNMTRTGEWKWEEWKLPTLCVIHDGFSTSLSSGWSNSDLLETSVNSCHSSRDTDLLFISFSAASKNANTWLSPGQEIYNLPKLLKVIPQYCTAHPVLRIKIT